MKVALRREREEKPGDADCDQHEEREGPDGASDARGESALTDCCERDRNEQREKRHRDEMAQAHRVNFRRAAVSNASITASTFKMPAAAMSLVP